MSEERPPHRQGPGTDPDDQRSPVPRSRSGLLGRYLARTGTEPLTAQSALGVRLLLSLLFTPLFLGATVVFALWMAHSAEGDSPSRASLRTLTLICAALFVFAAVDLLVVLRRRRRERGADR